MEVIKLKKEQRAWSLSKKSDGKTIAFVPTMGALHDGHISLIREAKKSADTVIVSIFVNPTQFDNPEDLEKYNKPIDDDLAICENEGVDCVFNPDSKEMYSEGYASFVEVCGNINETMCAITRAGHFRGVCTIVTKLFSITLPDIAVFGQKDLQQALIINRMANDLDLFVEVKVSPTVRGKDGLALSSRNSRFGEEGRMKAASIPKSLNKANDLFKQGTRLSNDLISGVAEELLMHEGVDLDYALIIAMQDFTEVDTAENGSIFAVAVFVDDVRLIDHIMLGGDNITIG